MAAGRRPPSAGSAGGGAPFRYTALGIRLISELPLPGLRSDLPCSGAPLRLSFRPGPARPPGDGWGLAHRSRVEDGEGNPLVRVWSRSDGARSFVYGDGHGFEVGPRAAHVRIRLPPASTVSAAILYFFGPVAAWILRRRGRGVLHASAVSLPGRAGEETGALLFVGDAGAGKSTAAAALVAAGARLLTDDTVALERGEHGVELLPDAPRLRLWPASAEALLGPEASLPPLTPGWEKRALDLEAARFDPQPRPVRAIYLIEARPGGDGACDGWRSEEVAPRQALLELLSHGSVSELLDPSMRRAELGLLADLLEACSVRRLLRAPAARPEDLPCHVVADLGLDRGILGEAASPSVEAPPSGARRGTPAECGP
ncbi:MAG: hypothetical protein MI919_07555 [Holophagales bacterium]|nr:hypothetical protein [Holophagales bacterium]